MNIRNYASSQNQFYFTSTSLGDRKWLKYERDGKMRLRRIFPSLQKN